MKIFIVLFGLLSIGLCEVNANEEQMQERIYELYNDLRCPTCQGLSVKDSEASFSVQIRQKTDELVEQGYSDQQVRDYFVARYGEWILRSPPKEGFNLLLWSVPGIGIFFALTLLYFWARKNANSSQQNHQVVEETEQSLTEEELARLNKDLQKFEKSNRL